MITTPKQTYYILALVSQNSNIYIQKTANKDFRAYYRSHYQGNYTATAHFFEEDPLPSLYLLEEINTTSDKAFGRCIAWYLHFESQDYHASASAVRRYIDHPRINDLRAYQEIKCRDLTDICRHENDIAADYHFLPVEYTVKFIVSPEERNTLFLKARSHNLKLAEYCQMRFDQAEIRCPDIRELAACSKQARTTYSLAQNIADHLRLNGSSNSVSDLITALQSLQSNINALETVISELTKAV